MSALTLPSLRIAVLCAWLPIACRGDATEPDPPGNTIASIVISPALDTLVALGDTIRMRAVATNASGSELDVSFTWSAQPAGIVSVTSSGVVTALAGGSTIIRASADDVSGEADIVVEQRPASIEVERGDAQGGPVAAPLDTLVAVRVRDAGGSPVPAITVRFAPSGDGIAEPPEATTDDAGIATTRWTLGAEVGVQELDAMPAGAADDVAIRLTANAHAGLPVSVVILDGDDQAELAEHALPAPIRVQVVDEAGNPAPDVLVFFSASDGGTVQPAEAFTDLDGIAASEWTLGAVQSVQTATARVFRSDSTASDSVEIAGSPVSFTSRAVPFAVVGVASGPAVVGAVMTLTGTGFDPVASNNMVLIGGRTATVLEGTQTTLSVEVPTFGCQPAASREVIVSRGALQGNIVTEVRAERTLDLDVGEYTILSEPELYCLQFAAAGAGTDLYLAGLTGTQPLNGYAAFELTGDDGSGSAPVTISSMPTLAMVPSAAAVTTGAAVEDVSSAESVLRAWERTFLRTRPRLAGNADGGSVASSGSAAQLTAAPQLGATLELRVPDITTDPCNQYTAIDATVIAVGPHFVLAADPAIPPLVLADLQDALDALLQLFSTMHERAVAYFGEAAWISADEVITVVLTPVAGDLGVAAFATAVDLIDRSTCPASDEREVVYVNIPDAPTVEQIRALLENAGPDLTHELAHVVQGSRRLQAGLDQLPPWIAEGAAELAVEIVGHALRGDVAGSDLGAGILTTDTLASAWYQPRFDYLARYFGWDGAGGRVDGAPARCSLFGFGGPGLACAPGYAKGAAWSFIRYMSDRLGSSYAGGEAGLHRDLVITPAPDLPGLLESIAATSLPELVVQWAMTLYTDNRLGSGPPPELQLTSWNLEDIEGASAPERRLVPVELGFGAFQYTSAIVGGGTAYFTIAAPGAHGPLAIDVRDPSGNAIGDELRPRLWVVRIQ